MTKKTILKKLQQLSFNELKNLHNKLNSEGHISTRYYTFQEMYELDFKGNVQEFLKKSLDDFINPTYEYVYYDPYTRPLELRSISERVLDNLLYNNINNYANIIYENQKYYYLEEIFTRWTQDI